MTPAEQNRAIAEWMGWTKIHTGYPMDGVKPGSVAALRHLIPNFYGDLNACWEFEERLTISQSRDYERALDDTVNVDYYKSDSCIIYPDWHATAPDRCEALLHTLGLWKEGE